MTDSAHGHDSKAPKHAHHGGGFDSEIDARRVIEVAVWLAVTTVVSLIIGFFLYKGLGRWADESDPQASPLAEANVAIEPPEPHLQAHPEGELAQLRHSNRERLATWGWVDRSAGVAHMPIDEAIARLAVPEPAAAAAPATAAPAETPAEAPAPPADAAHGGGH